MSITFYFKNDILYIRADGNECSMVDYSNDCWNETVSKLIIKGVTKDTLNNAAKIYGSHISEIKQYAIPFGELGIKIIREITRIATNHLTFVMTECEKISKQKKNKHSCGFVVVEMK